METENSCKTMRQLLEEMQRSDDFDYKASLHQARYVVVLAMSQVRQHVLLSDLVKFIRPGQLARVTEAVIQDLKSQGFPHARVGTIGDARCLTWATPIVRKPSRLQRFLTLFKR